MSEEHLTPELEKLLKEVKLKQPPQELMENYLAGVHAKMEQKAKPSFGFPQVGLILVVGLAFAGILAFYLTPSLNKPVEPVTVSSSEALLPISDSNLVVPVEEAQAVTPTEPAQIETVAFQELSLEEEMAILEAFEAELNAETTDLLEDEDVIEELVLLDEIELTSASQNTLPNA